MPAPLETQTNIEAARCSSPGEIRYLLSGFACSVIFPACSVNIPTPKISVP